MTNRGYRQIDGTDCFVSNATIPEYPIDTDEKRQAVVDFIDTICPDSDGAYEWDSGAMRMRHDRYVQLMYLAHNGLEHAAKEIESLRHQLTTAEQRGREAGQAFDIESARIDKIAKYVGATDHVDSIGPILTAIDGLRGAGREAGLREAAEVCAAVRARKHGDLAEWVKTPREIQAIGAISATEECEAAIGALLPAGEVG